jgi:carbamoyltransferase
VNILGINYIFHDTSACIVSDGDLLVAMEEERLTRKKHTTAFPREAITACLRQARMSLSDIDHIAVSVQPERMLSEKLAYAARLKSAARSFLAYEIDRLEARHITFWTWLHDSWPAGQPAPEVSFIDHHIAHAAGSYFVSPWEKAALLSVDGWGEWTTTWLGAATDLEIRKITESVFPHSLGLFYSAATEFCGFETNYDEGKTMGLAPTGDATRFYRDVNSMIEITPAGEVQLDMSWFAFEALEEGLCGAKLNNRFGPPRKKTGPIEQHHKDVAAAFQQVLEEKVLALCNILEKSTNAEHLVISGGVALNSVMNGRLIRETRFHDLYVMPGAGDNGTCIGAAYALYNGRLRQSARYHHNNPFIGTEYSDEEIRRTLTECKISYHHCTDVCRETAALLRAGRIVGWFQGRMEFGARSLGNRSILANPSLPDMKDRINSQVKHREAFRPFAPSVPAEHCRSYFDIRVESPFMLKVCPVREHRRRDIPAVTHVDGSARVQTVESTANGRYHELLTRFGELSGHPVLLNTSFNVMGEPIVESPLDAIRCFFSTGLDDLVIGDYLISK